jgi:hypothetical protein
MCLSFFLSLTFLDLSFYEIFSFSLPGVLGHLSWGLIVLPPFLSLCIFTCVESFPFLVPHLPSEFQVSTRKFPNDAYTNRRNFLWNHVSLMKPLFSIAHPSLLCNVKGKPILCFWPRTALLPREQGVLDSLIEVFNLTLSSIHDCHFTSVHAHRRHDKIKGMWRKGVHLGLHEFNRFSSTSSLQGRNWIFYKECDNPESILLSLKPLWQYLDHNLSSLFPNFHEKQMNLATAGGQLPTLFSSAFQTCALNKHPYLNSIHTDDNDFITGVFIGGKDFTGGALVYPQVNLSLAVRPGDIIWTFEDLIHYVENVPNGIRHSMTLYSKAITRFTTENPIHIPVATREILQQLK